MSYALNFVIPAGATGPQGERGPMGPKGENGTTGLNAYGGLYNSGGQINLGISTATPVILNGTMPNYNLSYDGNNGIVIKQTGTYEISYNLLFTITFDSQIIFNVRQNSTNIANLGITRNLTSNTNYAYHGSTILSLNENDVITMYLTSLSSTNVNLGSGLGASLIVKKID